MALADQIQEVAAAIPTADRRCCPRSAWPRSATAGSRRRRSRRSPTRSTTRPRTACRSRPSTTCSISSPSARHEVEVCTNLSCALVGAQEVVRAFESELGISAGETTEDGQVTLPRGRVPQRLWLRPRDRDRPSPAASGQAGGRPVDRRGASCRRREALFSRAPTSATLRGSPTTRRSVATRASRRRGR